MKNIFLLGLLLAGPSVSFAQLGPSQPTRCTDSTESLRESDLLWGDLIVKRQATPDSSSIAATVYKAITHAVANDVSPANALVKKDQETLYVRNGYDQLLTCYKNNRFILNIITSHNASMDSRVGRSASSQATLFEALKAYGAAVTEGPMSPQGERSWKIEIRDGTHVLTAFKTELKMVSDPMTHHRYTWNFQSKY